MHAALFESFDTVIIKGRRGAAILVLVLLRGRRIMFIEQKGVVHAALL